MRMVVSIGQNNKFVRGRTRDFIVLSEDGRHDASKMEGKVSKDIVCVYRAPDERV